MKKKILISAVSLAIVFLAIACNPPANKNEPDPLITSALLLQSSPRAILVFDAQTKCATGVTCSNGTSSNPSIGFGNIHRLNSTIATTTTTLVTAKSSVLVISNTGSAPLVVSSISGSTDITTNFSSQQLLLDKV